MDNPTLNPSGETRQMPPDPFALFETVDKTPVFGEFSKAAASLTYCAQVEKGYVSSIAIDYSDCDHFAIRAASVAGGRPRIRRRVRQDSFAIAEPEEGLAVISVGDGLGSLPYSHFAASLACQAVCSRLAGCVASLNQNLSALSPEDVLSPVNDILFKLRDSLSADFATTLVAAAILNDKPEEDALVWLARVGDSTAVTLSQTPGEGLHWQFLFGGEDNDEETVATTSTHAIPYLPLRYEHLLLSLQQDTALFLLTDGLSIPLKLGESVREGLGRRWLNAPSPLDFASHLSFNRRGELDDRTGVGVWLQKNRGDVLKAYAISE